ncbi:MAG: HEAT repeat domain-containing protein [Acidobacteriota bacterium]
MVFALIAVVGPLSCAATVEAELPLTLHRELHRLRSPIESQRAKAATRLVELGAAARPTLPSLVQLVEELRSDELDRAMTLGHLLRELGASPAQLDGELGSANPARRLAAAVSLASAEHAAARSVLADFFTSEERTVRHRCLGLLAELGEPSVVRLTEELEVEDSFLRRASAARAFWRMARSDAVEPTLMPVDRIIHRLTTDEHRDVRYLAAAALGHLPSESSARALLLALDDRDELVRESIDRALLTLLSGRSEGRLSSDPGVLQEVRRSLAQWEGGELLERLTPWSRNPTTRLAVTIDLSDQDRGVTIAEVFATVDDARVRSSLVRELTRQANPEDTPLLVELLEDDDSTVRVAAFRALRGRVVPGWEMLLREALVEERLPSDLVYPELAVIQDPVAMNILVDRLARAEKLSRGDVEFLARVGGPAAAELLVARLEKSVAMKLPPWREAFSTIGAEDALPALRRAAKSESAHVRTNVATACGTLGLPARGILLELIDDDDVNVVTVSLESLVKVDPVSARLEAVERLDGRMSWEAMRALGQVGDELSARALLRVEPRELSDGAREVLASALAGSTTGRERLASWCEDDALAKPASLALAEADDLRARAPLRRLLGLERGGRSRRKLLDAFVRLGDLDGLLELTCGSDELLARRTLDAIEQAGRLSSGNPSVVPELHARTFVESPWASVRRGALGALVAEPGSSPWQYLRRGLDDGDAKVRELAVQRLETSLVHGRHQREPPTRPTPEFEEALVSVLLDLLGEAETPDARVRAVRCLGYLGDLRALTALRELLHDGDDRLRAEALQALFELDPTSTLPSAMRALATGGRSAKAAARILGHFTDPWQATRGGWAAGCVHDLPEPWFD